MPSDRPEPIFTREQWDALRRNLQRRPLFDGGGWLTGGVHLHFETPSEVEVVTHAEDAPVGPPPPTFAEIELLEEDAPQGGPVVPRLFVLDGKSYWTSADQPLRISDIEGDSLVEVTVTFIAKSVSIRSADQN